MEPTLPEGYNDLKNKLDFELPISYPFNGEWVKDVELLKSNGVAEEVFLKRSAEKSYTWIANIITIASAKLGNNDVAVKAREEFVKSKSITIPAVVRKMYLANANTMLLEVHRRVWQNLMRTQEIMCKYCTKMLVSDIDLNRIEMGEENLAVIKEAGETPFEYIKVPLVDGFTLDEFITKMKKEETLGDLKGIVFNEMVFRIPLLEDAIKNEKLAASDNIKFWRKMAIDCTVQIKSMKDSKEIAAFPMDQYIFLALKLFDNYLTREDLALIRTCLREDVPTMPFDYKDTCPCDQQREIPMAMEATGFFSERR